ncbi:twin-arginine translocation pathway signal protein [Bradyrhizobium sp. Arg237L]|uniref:ABC transporter substrate-binding protein n=1 Tax=Bradyrhizobium sp. Arg237L TaxID=3003352 RepID=UPI00249F24DE|nr:twin-arginine translocation pathway signal protein [Bradyrhizobium sp. Arg237L]MDI4238277.1 twin-arginine translocation pathway signal protein [Bradyrhizobium sp. Arg237L]
MAKTTDRNSLPSRRALMGAALSAGAWAALSPSVLRAQDLPTIRCATATPGFTTVFYDVIRDRKLDEKNGFKLDDPVLNASIGTLFNDFVAGSSDVIVASWDPVLTRYQAGVPCQLLCTLMTADMIGIVATKAGPQSIAALKGKIIAAPQQSGVYRMTRAIIKELTGEDIETVAQVQNADNPAQGVTLVIADRADAAVAWEPMISSGMQKRKDIDVIFSAGKSFREKIGADLPYFCVNVRKEMVAAGMAPKLNAAFAECVKIADTEFDAIAVKYAARTKIDVDTLKIARESGRFKLQYGAANDPKVQATLTTASEMLARQGVLPRKADPGFFAA